MNSQTSSTAVVVIGSGCSIRVEVHRRINLVRLSFCFTSHFFQFYHCLTHFYISNKMECFCYRGGCGVCGFSTCIKALKEELA